VLHDVRRQVGGRVVPCVVDLVADQRQLGDLGIGRLDGQRMVLDGVVEIAHLAGKRISKQHQRNAEQQQAGQHHGGGGEPAFASEPTDNAHEQGIKRDGEDQAGDHQAGERREHAHAEINEEADQRDPDHRLHQVLSQQFAKRRLVYVHLENLRASATAPRLVNWKGRGLSTPLRRGGEPTARSVPRRRASRRPR
jgi:hypothetical protein